MIGISLIYRRCRDLNAVWICIIRVGRGFDGRCIAVFFSLSFPSLSLVLAGEKSLLTFRRPIYRSEGRHFRGVMLSDTMLQLWCGELDGLLRRAKFCYGSEAFQKLQHTTGDTVPVVSTRTSRPRTGLRSIPRQPRRASRDDRYRTRWRAMS